MHRHSISMLKSQCSLQDGCPAAKKHHSMIQGTQYEECDLNEEEDATFFVITNTNDIPQKVCKLKIDK